MPPAATKLSAVTTRNYTPSDYATLCSLWTAQKWPSAPEAALPKTGRIALIGGQIAAAGFLYRTDSSLALLEWIIADPSLPAEARGEAVNAVLTTLIEAARSQGYAALFHMTSHKRLISRLQEHGFNVTDSAQSHLLKVL